METALWIFAFIGVALIYPVPYIFGKLNLNIKFIYASKIVGVVMAAICLIVLARMGVFSK